MDASVLDGSATAGRVALCVEFPIDDFEQKPCEPSQLARKNHRLLNTKRSTGEMHSSQDDGRHLTRDVSPTQDGQALTNFPCGSMPNSFVFPPDANTNSREFTKENKC